MFSIYVSAFNLKSGLFDYEDALLNFTEFAEEVVVSTLDDGSIELLNECRIKHKLNFKIEVSNESLDDYAFDGKIKNHGLQATTNPYKISLDLDERIPIWQKDKWIEMGESMYSSNSYDAVLIPSINLCGSFKTYKDIGHKWYLHKTGLKRGIVNFAKLDNNKIDISKSDTCELLYEDNTLVKYGSYPGNVEVIRDYNIPFIYHLWAVNSYSRIKKNLFWKPVWENRAGHEVKDILLNDKDISTIPIFQHNLPLWNKTLD
jgi:hypothetical protein